jgi:uncharacterized protein
MNTDDSRRAVGKVVSVAADHLIVELHGSSVNFTIIGFDDIHYVARLGAFIAIAIQSEYVIAEVVGLREKDGPLSRDASSREAADKSRSLKYLDLVPIGTLPQRRDGSFRFGVSNFPSLYSDALYVMDDELDRIFEVAGSVELVENSNLSPTPTRIHSLPIGTSVVFKDYSQKIRVNEFFGGHSAVLGNTGSGKSCTVATILQSLFTKPDNYAAHGATFFILDVNGEYRNALSQLPSNICRRYVQVSSNPLTEPVANLDKAESTSVFRLPHWFMSVEEWELLLRASERTQQPVLRTALGLSSLFSKCRTENFLKVKNHILGSCISHILQTGDGSGAKNDRITALLVSFSTPELNLAVFKPLIIVDFGRMPKLEEALKIALSFVQDGIVLPSYSNCPFDFDQLGHALNLALLYEEAHGNGQIRDYCAQMLTRFKWIREREEFSFLRVSFDELHNYEKTIPEYVEHYLGVKREGTARLKSHQVILLDLNEAADEVVELAAAVMSRLIFDRLRRAESRNALPVNLVLEEAHRYISERTSGYAIDASKIFERIAKEGRKYGLFLMVASQRPSELSKTVLSQCSNFVVHRIQNPDDLIQIRQMTPFISDSVLKRLPSLPKQHALIFGNAVNLPTTFKVRDVHPKPKSDDAAISELWYREVNAPIA